MEAAEPCYMRLPSAFYFSHRSFSCFTKRCLCISMLRDSTMRRTWKFWALDHHHLRVEFSVAAEHKGERGPMANAGDGHGIATIQGNTAIFKPEGADTDCRITLKFKRHNLVITQTTRCDFGKYANVAGTYKKVSTSKPVFRFAL